MAWAAFVHEVHHHLVNLSRIRQNGVSAEMSRRISTVEGKGRAQQLEDFLYQRTDIEWFDIRIRLAAECQNLCDQISGVVDSEPESSELRPSAAVFLCYLSVYPIIAARMLLKSWAIPPASVPMASSLWTWKSLDSDAAVRNILGSAFIIA